MEKDAVEGVGEGLVERWFEYHRLSTGTRAERKSLETGSAEPAVAAIDAVREVMRSGGEWAVRLIEELITAAQSDDDLLTVGVGQLEDLRAEHGDEIVDAVIAAARRSERFATSLQSVWLEPSTVRPETAQQLAPWVPDLARKVDSANERRRH